MGINTLDMDRAGPLLGIFFGVTVFMTVLFLDKVQGQAFKIQDFLAGRRWNLIESDAAINRINFILKISCYVFFSIPVITLIFWGTGVIYREDEEHRNVSGGISIFLLGFSLLFFLYGVFRIKWNKYILNLTSGLSILTAVILLGAYKMVVIFVNDNQTYFGISAIFLSANGVVMIVITFLNNHHGGITVYDVTEKLPVGEPLDINRGSNYEDEITAAYEEDDYIPTQNEIYEMFTINRVNMKKGIRGTLKGGFAKAFSNLSKCKKNMITLALYLFALVILGLYAMIDYLVRDESGIGVVTMLAVLATDLILYLYVYSNFAETPAEISLHLVAFRICLFIFGENYWIYGYCILYIYIGIFLSYHIAKKRFPFLEAIAEQSVEDEEEAQHKPALDIATTPEFLFMLATALFAVLMGIMIATKPEKAPLKDLETGDETLEFWVYGLFSVLITFIVFFSLLVYRIFERYRTGVESKIHFFIHFKNYNLLFFFITLDYLLIVILAILCWWATNDTRYLIVGILTPLALCFLINFLLRLMLNDYHYAQDITKINKQIDKHNKHVDQIKQRVKRFKKSIASKTGQAAGKVALTAQEIQELAKKKLKHDDNLSEDEELKDIEQDEEEEEKGLKYDDNEEIEEGGEEEKKETKFAQEVRTKSSAVPRQDVGETIFKEEGFSKNLFGRVASIMLNDEEIDYDGDYLESVKATKKIKMLFNWKKKYNWCSAFWTRKLRSNDYHIFFSYLFAFIINIGIAVALSLDKGTVEGISWAVGFQHVYLTYGVMARPLACDAETNIPETIIYIFSHLVVYGWGLADFAIRFDFDPNKGDGNYFLVWYVTLIPWVTLTTTGFYKWYDSNWKFSKFVIIVSVFAIAAGIACMVCCYIFIGPVSGTVIAFILGILIYFGIMIKVYSKYEKYLPKVWQWINIVILSLLALVAFIVSL